MNASTVFHSPLTWITRYTAWQTIIGECHMKYLVIFSLRGKNVKIKLPPLSCSASVRNSSTKFLSFHRHSHCVTCGIITFPFNGEISRISWHCNLLMLLFFILLPSRVFAPKCHACGGAITPLDGTDETVRVVSMDKDYHVDCYTCEDCGLQLTDEPANRCYPLDNHLLCQSCHLKRIGSHWSSGLLSIKLRASILKWTFQSLYIITKSFTVIPSESWELME